MENNEVEPFICINYPGIVKNKGKMIETFGGKTKLAEALGDTKNKKLQLWFRPEDRLCKPVTSTRSNSNTLLMKIKVNKKNKKVLSYEVIGQVQEEHKFNSLCDFQYLALDNGTNIYDQIIPTKLNPHWLTYDSPSFLIPGEFSRSDTIQGYYFSGKKAGENEATSTTEVIASSRRKRLGLAIFVGFEDSAVPAGPKEMPDSQKNAAYSKELGILRQALEKRPVLTKCVIAGITGLSHHILRDLMPYVAYHFHNGPWRANWVKFGYDPREDPAARIYQTLDYRIQVQDHENMVASQLDTVKSWPRPPKRVPLVSRVEGVIHEKYILKPGDLPPCRQFFYQYCDIKIPEVEALVASVEVNAICHLSNGWFPEGTAQACRRIIREYVTQALTRLTNEVGDASLCLDDYIGSSDGEQEDFNESDDAAGS